VIVASHELERAGSLADRIVDVQGGQIRLGHDGSGR
jgi:energy-coupling factor transporter ATP-binding protein EcfA2